MEVTQSVPTELIVANFWLRWVVAFAVLAFFLWHFTRTLRRFQDAMERPDPVRGTFWVESRWGGLGGGLGGWRVSNAIVYLALLAVVGGLMLATTSYVIPSFEKSDQTGKGGTGGAATKGEKRADAKPAKKDESKAEPVEDTKHKGATTDGKTDEKLGGTAPKKDGGKTDAPKSGQKGP